MEILGVADIMYGREEDIEMVTCSVGGALFTQSLSTYIQRLHPTHLLASLNNVPSSMPIYLTQRLQNFSTP